MNIESIVEDFYNVPNKLRKHKNQIKMKNYKYQVWAKRGNSSFVVELPFSDVKDAHEFMWSAMGVKPSSMSKL